MYNAVCNVQTVPSPLDGKEKGWGITRGEGEVIRDDVSCIRDCKFVLRISLSARQENPNSTT